MLEQRRGRGERALLGTEHHGDDRRGVAGPEPLDVPTESGDQLVALGRAEHAQRRERRGSVGGSRMRS